MPDSTGIHVAGWIPVSHAFMPSPNAVCDGEPSDTATFFGSQNTS